jgi:histidinol phosphatase-like enzyme
MFFWEKNTFYVTINHIKGLVLHDYYTTKKCKKMKIYIKKSLKTFTIFHLSFISIYANVLIQKCVKSCVE